MAVWIVSFAALDKLDHVTRNQHFPNVTKQENTLFFCSNEYATSECAVMVIPSFLSTISRWLVHTAIRVARGAQRVMPPPINFDA